MFKNDKNQQGGVSIKIEVASRFEKSNRLYQKEAFTSLFLEGSGGVHPLKISTFQFPKMRFPAFWALNPFWGARFFKQGPISFYYAKEKKQLGS